METMFGQLPDKAPRNKNPRLPKEEVVSMVADRAELVGILALGGANSNALGKLWRDIRVIDDRLNDLLPMRRYG